jgi:hypothetical protein
MERLWPPEIEIGGNRRQGSVPPYPYYPRQYPNPRSLGLKSEDTFMEEKREDPTVSGKFPSASNVSNRARRSIRTMGSMDRRSTHTMDSTGMAEPQGTPARVP